MPNNGTALAPRDDASIIESVIIAGDLEKLTPAQRTTYYSQVCQSLSLNPLTQPFQYIRLSGKLTLYAGKGCTDQLRDLKEVSIARVEEKEVGDIFMVTAYATRGERQDCEIGAVSISGLRGEALANAYMKAITKAKRRVTLSICGLGMLDESEVDSIPDAQTVVVDSKTGEVLETRSAKKRSDMVTSAADPAWVSWQQLLVEARGTGIGVPDVALPIGVVLLRNKYRQLRDSIVAKQAAGILPVPALPDGAPEGSSVTPDVTDSGVLVSDPVTDKNDPDWKAWLEAERKARIAGSDVDTSAIKLGISRADLLEFTQTLSETEEEPAF